MSPNSGSRAAEYSSHLTWRCCLICIMAGCGGLLFGYDLGESPFAAERALNPFCSTFGLNFMRLARLSTCCAGIAGGVASMDPFLQRFFPQVIQQKADARQSGSSTYCQYDNELLQVRPEFLNCRSCPKLTAKQSCPSRVVILLRSYQTLLKTLT